MPRLSGFTVYLVVVMTLLNGRAWAEQQGQVTIELDVAALVAMPRVLEQVAEDPIWEITPGPGRSLVQLPVRIKVERQPVELTTSELRLSRARFLAWSLLETAPPDQQPHNNQLRPRQQPAAFPGQGQAWGQQHQQDVMVFPRFTRRLTVNPDGTGTWRLDRFILQGTVKQSDQLYAMRIDRSLLQARHPGSPPSIQRNQGEDNREFMVRRQTAQREYRVLANEYQQLMRQVNSLNDDYQIRLPEPVWAVFDLPMGTNDLELTDGILHAPWRISLAQLTLLQELAGSQAQTITIESQDHGQDAGQTQRTRLPYGEMNHIMHLSAMIGDNHPYSYRAVAYVLVRRDLIRHVEMGQPLYMLVRRIIDSDDREAQRMVVNALMNVPPSRDTASLLHLVAQKNLDVGRAADVISNLFNVDLAQEPGQIQEVIRTANQVLADPNGPAPGEVLDALCRASRQQFQVLSALSTGIQFRSMPTDRREAAMIYVIEHAGVEPLASYWLNHRFLGAADRSVVERTLRTINAAEGVTGMQSLAPVIRRGLDTIFGPPVNEQAASGGIRLKALIPIDSANHGLFRALQHGDPHIRTLAWQGLANFTLNVPQQRAQPPADTPRRGRPAGDFSDDAPAPQQETGPSRYEVLLSAALNQTPTPPQIVSFLMQQPDHRQAADALVQLVLRGSSEASGAAARAIRGSNLPIGQALLGLSFGERQGFATRMYQNLLGRVPLVTAVMRQRMDRNPVVVWFGDQVAAGTLPATGLWADQYRSENELLGMINSNDFELARGAMAALVSAIGGSDRQATALVTEMRSLPDQNLDSLRAHWEQYRQSHYAQVMQRHAGPYRIVVRTVGQLALAGENDAGALPGILQEQSLGIVHLVIDAATVSLGGQQISIRMGDQGLGLRIDSVAELRNLPGDEAADLPLDQVNDPLDLLPQADGSWLGHVILPAGNQRLELHLQPARE